MPESEEEAPPRSPAVIWQDQGTSIPGRVNCSPKERATAHYPPRLSHLVWLESREDPGGKGGAGGREGGPRYWRWDGIL